MIDKKSTHNTHTKELFTALLSIPWYISHLQSSVLEEKAAH